MPRGRKGSAVDQSLFEAALIGFEQMRRNVEERMTEIRHRLGTRDGAAGTAPGPQPRRTMSAAAHRRIAAAQRKRWAAARAHAKPVRAKRTMSASARKKIAAAQRKRWAAVKAKGTAKAGRGKTKPKMAKTSS
jgi:hypothetical protein